MSLLLAIGTWVFGLGVLGVLTLVMWVFALTDLFGRSDLDRQQRSSWILVIVLLPLVGSIYYLTQRRR